MGVLLFENPEYKAQLKTLQNKAQELFGMTLAKYLQSAGILAKKRGRWERPGTPAPAAGQEEDAPIAGLSPAATARLREYYEGLNPRFYGTFQDAVQKLEGLEAGCTRRAYSKFYIAGVTACRADVETPQGIAFIGQGAFQNQTGLETIVLPESLTEIHASAFEGCTGLRRVILPAGLNLVDSRAFGGCAALEEVDFQGGRPWVDGTAFQGSGYRYIPPENPESSDGRDFTWTSSSGGVSITGYTGGAEKLEIPRLIRGLPVYGISEGAFKGCRSLTEVTMPDTIEEIQRGAFEDCVNLQKIHLSNAVSRLAPLIFYGCTALREVNIPDGVTSLPQKVFKDAPLERVHIGKGLETLDTDVFGMRSLAEITVDPENPRFKGGGPCLYSADGRVLYAFWGEGFFLVPEGVERIRPGAFSGRNGLTEVVFPATLTEIGSKAFFGSSLRRVEFGEAVRTIGNSAFEKCSRLSSALFSEGLERVGNRAFRGCPIRLVVLPSTLRQLGENCFDSLSQERTDTPQELRITPGGPWEADGDGLYRIDGESKTLIRVYAPRFFADCRYGYEKTACTVAEGTTAIGQGAFQNCRSLRSVTLPDSLREIGDRAFYGCTELRGVRLPQGLRSIGVEAFRGASVRDITIPPELTSIGTGAFAAGEDRSPSLRKVRVAKKNPCFLARENVLLQRKEDGSLLLLCAFGKSETVTVPEGITEIGRLAFYRSAVKEVRLPASVREVAADAFHECGNLTRLRLELPESAPGWAEVYFPELCGYGWSDTRKQYLDCIRTSRDAVDRQERAEELAVRILKYARNELLVAFRFLDLALCKPELQAGNPETLAIDGKYLRFNPKFIFELYKQGGGELNHSYLHSIFHCVFSHPFVNPSINRDLWDLACDIAVEGILNELNMKQLETLTGSAMAVELAALEQGGKLTAERLYKRFTDAPPSPGEYRRLRDLFRRDEHGPWYAPPERTGTASPNGPSAQSGTAGQPGPGGQSGDSQKSGGLQDEWQTISQRIQVDLETASQLSWGDRAANLLQNVQEVNREKYDYSDFLRKFAVLGEDMQLSDDEFDYIFYTYGLQLYENVPLIEPLEYKEVRKIKDFVIAIDTSGSVQGELVQTFLTKTYNILAQQESFFSKINVHIIQCDAKIQEDHKVTSWEEFQAYLKVMRLKGFGGTDFRPVFRYVEELRKQGEFDIVTWDRLKRVDVEPDYEAWKEYAYKKGIHGSILTFLEIKKNYFYIVETTVDRKSFVTARGWEDLSEMIKLYERHGLTVDQKLTGQYLQNPAVAREFAVYYDLYNKYRSDYQIEDILSGKASASVRDRTRAARFDERLSLLGLLIDAVNGEMRRAVETDNAILENLRVLKQVKTQLNQAGASYVTVLHKHLDAERTALRLGQKANSIDYETSYSYNYVIRFLEDILDALNRKGVSESQEAFQQIKAAYDASAAAHKTGIANIKARLENLFQFVEEAFEDGQEMLILVTELTMRYYCAKFISKFGCDAYFKHNQNLMFYQRKQELLTEIAALEEL